MLHLQMHDLAYFYHWPPNLLWKLPHSERVMWWKMVREQLRAENEGISGNSDFVDSGTPPKYKESM